MSESELKTVTHVELPLSVMRAIELIVHDEETPPANRYIAAVLISMGYGAWQSLGKVDPTKIAIPEEQWREICQWLVDIKGNDIDKVNYALDWMNRGPSSYKANTERKTP
jgi:hypothetical protein